MTSDCKIINKWPDEAEDTVLTLRHGDNLGHIKVVGDGKMMLVSLAKGDAVKLRDALSDWINK